MRTRWRRWVTGAVALAAWGSTLSLSAPADAAPGPLPSGPDLDSVELLVDAIEAIDDLDGERYDQLVARVVDGEVWLPAAVFEALLDRETFVLDFWIDILDEDDIALYSWASVLVDAERRAILELPPETSVSDDLVFTDADGATLLEVLDHRALPVPPRARIALDSLVTPGGAIPEMSVYDAAVRVLDGIHMSGDPFSVGPTGPASPPSGGDLTPRPAGGAATPPAETQPTPAPRAAGDSIDPSDVTADTMRSDASSNLLLMATLVIALLAMIVGLAAVVRGRRHDRLADFAFTDGLTGLRNRRRMDVDVAEQVEASTRPTATLMIDVDHFKRFNDVHGHAMGDDVLRLVGQTLGRHFRRTDVPYRYGGEEFCVLLPETTEAEAMLAGERIRAAIEAIELPIADRITVSIGVSIGPASDVSSTIERADGALYVAKESGRNRVEFA